MNIEVKNITFSYNQIDNLFEDFSLKINDGEFTAILGHNGSGKSTLAKIIMGLLPITKGSIYYNDKEINRDNRDIERKNLAIIFQNPDNQFVGSTVKDDIAFGLENLCINREEMIKRIDKYAKMVNMEEFLSRDPESLSGGQKQRVSIAGALAMETDVIIFDESTSMLDPEGTKEINEAIKNLKKMENKTIISITHNIEEVVYADRIIVLKKGKVVLDGKPKDVLSQKDILIDAGLNLIDSVALINELSSDDKYKDVVKKLWELTFNM